MDKQAYIERDMFGEVSRHLGRPEITLITGSRQVGKAVLLEQLREHLVDSQRISSDSILAYNLDLVRDWEVFQDQTAWIEFLQDRSRRHRLYVFVDEAQKVPEAARFFKGVYDANVNAKLVLTGSSSLELKAKLRETLAGRKRVFHLPPFTFQEFLRARDRALAADLARERLPRLLEKKIASLYEEYMTFGGYPRVVLSESREEKTHILHEIYSSYVEKDAVGFLEIRNRTAFNRLVKLLAAQIGQLVNIGELAANLNVDRNTVERYIQALEDTFIIKRITPYFRNPRQEIIKAGKVYFLDCGIRNLALEDFRSFDDRTDKGALLENAAFIELSETLRDRSGTLHFWRTKQGAEVDFVVERGVEVLPVEVKAALRARAVATGLRSFVEKTHPNIAAVANLSIDSESLMLGTTRVLFLYPFRLPSALKKD